MTANEIDMSIIGVEGRSKVLREIADDLGMAGEDIVPPKNVIQQRLAVQKGMAEEAAVAQGQVAQQERPKEPSEINQPEAPV
jgi:hypothetical protein